MECFVSWQFITRPLFPNPRFLMLPGANIYRIAVTASNFVFYEIEGAFTVLKGISQRIGGFLNNDGVN